MLLQKLLKALQDPWVWKLGIKMSKKGKRSISNEDGIDFEKNHNLTEAVALVKSKANAKFDETIEVSMNLGLDPSQSDQTVRGVVSLPNGIGKDVRVAVFARGDIAKQAEDAGADLVGAEELVDEVASGKIDFDRCISCLLYTSPSPRDAQ